MHCDPCENICDKPLLYEQGWKKKLSLVVAVNSEQIVDVTMRYTVDQESVNQRRSAMFNSKWLAQKIEKLNATNASSVRPQRLVSIVAVKINVFMFF